jgi:release factor glutamine methyltransferase
MTTTPRKSPHAANVEVDAGMSMARAAPTVKEVSTECRARPVRCQHLADLRSAGCVAAEEELSELEAAAERDDEMLRRLVARRLGGEPLAWIVGSVLFCGERVAVHPGVYVPRWQTEPLVRFAVEHLPPKGVAVDLCTGAGAVAVVLARHRPSARVLATDIDLSAVRCALANGVDVRQGDVADGLPAWTEGRADVVTAVTPYVPTPALRLLPRDVRVHEPRRALDGGPDGTVVLRRVVDAAARLLHEGGLLCLELAAEQPRLLEPVLVGAGFEPGTVLLDDDGDVRGLVSCRRPPATGTAPQRVTRTTTKPR